MMAVSGRKDSKRIEAFRQLKEARELLAKAGDRLASGAEALELVEEGQVKGAGEVM